MSMVRVMAIDPGTNTLGVAILEQKETGEITVLDVRTHIASKMTKRYPHLLYQYGDLQTRLYAMKESLKRTIQYWTPDLVVCESAYMGKFAHSFMALTQVKEMLFQVVRESDPMLSLVFIEPSVAKKAVGVNGSRHDKDGVRDALLTLPLLQFNQTIPFTNLDEHSTDAIAIGYAYLTQLGYKGV